MKRSVTRRRVSTRRATVPCVRGVCNSSSRFSEVALDFELITLSWSVAAFRTGDGFFFAQMELVGSGGGDAIASSGLGRVERAVGAREKQVRRLMRFKRRDARGDRCLQAGREGAPVEIGDDNAQPVENSSSLVTGRIGEHHQEFLAAVTAEPVDSAD